MQHIIKCCLYIDMLTALYDATNDLAMACHKQRAGAPLHIKVTWGRKSTRS